MGIILLIKSLIRNKLGANWHYAIWALLFLQLVLPWTPTSPLSIYKLIPGTYVESIIHSDMRQSRISAENPVVSTKSPTGDRGLGLNSSTVSSELPNVSEEGLPNSTLGDDYIKTPVNPLREYAAGLWLAGCLFFVGRIGIAEHSFRKRIMKAVTVNDSRLLAILENCKQLAGVSKTLILMETDALKSPALFGVFRTRLLLPTGLADNLTSEQLAHVFLHELIHYKRQDIALNWAAAALRVMHWFNPLIWYGFKRWQEDQEISRDALAVKYLKPEVVKEYGRTLIRVLELAGAQPSRLISTVGITGGKSLSQRRIIMISLFRKPSFKWSLVGAAVIIAVAVVAMTFPKAGVTPVKQPFTSSAKNQGNSNVSAEKNGTAKAANEQVPQVSAGKPAQELPVQELTGYKNVQYGFSFSLPESWQGYSIINDKWEGLAIGSGGDQVVETGTMIYIRHPLWTWENKRQDIPIMIFTLAQWNSLQQDKFHIGAAPIRPSELGRNNGYVFALPARYNYAFPTGFEEVEQILNNKPLKTEGIQAPEQPAKLVSAVLGDYFPLHKGNKWVYQGTGNEYASFSREVLFTKGNLAQTMDINGGANVSKVVQMNSNTVTEIFKREEPADPVNLLHEKANEQRVLLKSPLSIGTKWNESNSQLEIVDTAATIETPAGTFENCIKVKSTFSNGESVMYQYYAKGVGMVQQDFIVGGEKISSSLESYHLVK